MFGTPNAHEFIRRGHRIVQSERDAEALATVRNFGLIWVPGRSTAELPATLQARELWERLGAATPGVGFRPTGSVTRVSTEAELAVPEEISCREDRPRGIRRFRPPVAA